MLPATAVDFHAGSALSIALSSRSSSLTQSMFLSSERSCERAVGGVLRALRQARLAALDLQDVVVELRVVGILREDAVDLFAQVGIDRVELVDRFLRAVVVAALEVDDGLEDVRLGIELGLEVRRR